VNTLGNIRRARKAQALVIAIWISAFFVEFVFTGETEGYTQRVITYVMISILTIAACAACQFFIKKERRHRIMRMHPALLQDLYGILHIVYTQQHTDQETSSIRNFLVWVEKEYFKTLSIEQVLDQLLTEKTIPGLNDPRTTQSQYDEIANAIRDVVTHYRYQ
jgi:hypothetical protein